MPLFIFPILGAILLSLAQTSHLGFLVFFGFIPLLYGFFRLRETKADISQFITLGLVAGLIYSAVSLFWLWSLYPLNNLGVTSRLASFVIIFLLWSISSFVMSLCWGLIGLVFVPYRKSLERSPEEKTLLPKPTILLLTFPAILTLAEYLRAFALELTWLGQGSAIGPHFPFGNLAYSLVDFPFTLKLASYIGIYGITFLIALLNGVMVMSLTRKRRRPWLRYAIIGCVVIELIVLSNWHPHTANRPIPDMSSGVSYAIIQTNKPTNIEYTDREQLDAFKEQLGLLNDTAKAHSDTQIIVSPEASNFLHTFLLFFSTDRAKAYFNSLFSKNTLFIVGSDYTDEQAQRFSEASFIDTKLGIFDSYEKVILTPAGEFLPYSLRGFLRLFYNQDLASYIQSRVFHKGPMQEKTIAWQGIDIAPLICSDLLSPSYVRLQSQHAQIIITQMSLSIFQNNPQMIRDTQVAGRFRAAENAKPVVISSNMAQSYGIDSSGVIISKTTDATAQILTGKLALNQGQTWYNRLGDWPILLLSFGLIVAYGAMRRFRD